MPTLGLGEQHYLALGILPLVLGVVQVAFAAMAILSLILVGLSIVVYPPSTVVGKRRLRATTTG